MRAPFPMYLVASISSCRCGVAESRPVICSAATIDAEELCSVRQCYRLSRIMDVWQWEWCRRGGAHLRAMGAAAHHAARHEGEYDSHPEAPHHSTQQAHVAVFNRYIRCISSPAFVSIEVHVCARIFHFVMTSIPPRERASQEPHPNSALRPDRCPARGASKVTDEADMYPSHPSHRSARHCLCP